MLKMNISCMINSKKKINYILVFFLFAFCCFCKSIQYDYDDLWFDEISSFWVSDPKFHFKKV